MVEREGPHPPLSWTIVLGWAGMRGIVSLAAALLVSKGGTRGATEQAVLNQLVKYPRALFVAALLMVLLALVPGLPFLPFALLGSVFIALGYIIPRRLERTL